MGDSTKTLESALFAHVGGLKDVSDAKVTVVGAGAVGMACAYAILARNIASEIALVDVIEKRVMAEKWDLEDGLCFLSCSRVSASKDISASEGSKLVIITAGVRQEVGESRLNLVQRNVNIFKNIVPALAKASPDSLILVISNPVDIMTYVTWKLSGFPKNRVFGSGTHLDTARFRFNIAERLRVHPSCIDGFVIGEHGDSSVPIWSTASISGVRLQELNPKVGEAEDDPENWHEVHQDVVHRAYRIIEGKGYTNWAIGMGTSFLAEAVLKNTGKIYPATTCVQGLHGIEDVWTSLPCALGAEGVCKIVQLTLSDKEKEKLQCSARTLNEIQMDLQW